MHIALLGHGNMGKEIERLLESTSHTCTVLPVDSDHPLDVGMIKDVDVVIEFTSPEVVLDHIQKVTAAGKNMVVGTTGWYDRLPEIQTMLERSGTGLIYAQNFSIGANIFFALVAHASKLTAGFGGYDPYGLEIHHVGKKDSPSGTALRTAEEILKNFPDKKKIQTEKMDRQISSDELHFASVRAGRNPGYHQVVFDSVPDEISLSHAAHSRSGFAAGAIAAAEFIHSKKGLYTFDDVIKEKQNV